MVKGHEISTPVRGGGRIATFFNVRTDRFETWWFGPNMGDRDVFVGASDTGRAALKLHRWKVWSVQ